MSQATKPTATAPSAAPAAAAPASPAAPVTPAPAAAATEPQNLNDFAELARKSIAGETAVTPAEPATPAPEPATPGQEPSPGEPEITPAEPSSETNDSPAADDGDEPTEAEMANWTEGEKKLHGALVKERAESKEARKQLREMKQQLDELQRQRKPANPSPAEPETPAPQSAAPRAGTLQDCMTFEAVDAKAAAAAETEIEANRLQMILNRNGTEPVVERLLQKGVKDINGKPVAEASADEIGDFLAAVYEGSKLTQAQAPLRKHWLEQNRQSLQQAVQLVPELNDASSAAYKATMQFVQQNRDVLQRPNWPVIVAKLWLGEQALAGKSKPAAPAAPAPKVPAKPAAKPAPGAPRTSVAAMPAPSAREALAAKIASGTASLAEVQEYTRGFVAA